MRMSLAQRGSVFFHILPCALLLLLASPDRCNADFSGLWRFVVTGSVRGETVSGTGLHVLFESGDALYEGPVSGGDVEIEGINGTIPYKRIADNEYALADPLTYSIQGAQVRIDSLVFRFDTENSYRTSISGSVSVSGETHQTLMSGFGERMTPQLLTGGMPLAELSGGGGGFAYFAIEVPEGASELHITTSGGWGDCDLGAAGSWPPFIGVVSDGDGNDEEIRVSSPNGGLWYAVLYGFERYGDVTLTPYVILPPDTDVPPAPTLKVTTFGTTCTISWTQAANGDGYILYYAPYPDLSYIGNVDVGNQTGPFTFALWDGAAFYLAVQAYNAFGTSAFSNIEHFVITLPPDPLDIDDDGDGTTENQGDCNDFDSSIHPGASEICGDGIDQDCDGTDQSCTPSGPVSASYLGLLEADVFECSDPEEEGGLTFSGPISVTYNYGGAFNATGVLTNSFVYVPLSVDIDFSGSVTDQGALAGTYEYTVTEFGEFWSSGQGNFTGSVTSEKLIINFSGVDNDAYGCSCRTQGTFTGTPH